jgi:hypothetical protein
MFNSISALEKRARKINSDYYDWIEQNSAGPNTFNPSTPTTVLQLQNSSVRIEGFARLAQELMVEPGFADADFDPVLKADIQAIAEELKVAFDEIVSAVHPDTIWQDLDHGTKTSLTHNHILPDHKVDLFRARLKGDLRKQAKIAPPADEPKPDPKQVTAPPPPAPPPTPPAPTSDTKPPKK